jgi:hypothetical protein
VTFTLPTTKPLNVGRRYLPGLCGFGFTVTAGIIWATMNFGSLSHAWLYAAGVRAIIEPASVTLKGGKPGDVCDAVLTIHNFADTPLRVLGVTTTCTCVSTEKLPLVIAPRGRKEVRVTVHVGASSSERPVQTVEYHTNHPSAPNLMVTITARE